VEAEDGGDDRRKKRIGASWQSPKSRADLDAENRALELFRAGKHDQAISILMTLYAAPLVTMIRRIVDDAELAKDIRQIVFLQALRDLEQFEGRSSVWSWLCGIAANRSIDAIRKRRSRAADKQEPSELLDQLAAPEDADVDHDHAALRALESCLQKLPDELRSEVLLRYKSGLSYQEIAEIRQKKAGTLQVRIARGLAQLRDCLRRKGVER
jgi:RNA polymerase sigma factor (sigma-70 family)